MPWDSGPSFAAAHNKKLTGAAASKAAEMATAMVKAGVPEGIAIATANKHGDKMLAMHHPHHARGGFGSLKKESFKLSSPSSLKLSTDPGGGKAIGMGMATPWWTRRAASLHGFQFGGATYPMAGERQYGDMHFGSGLIPGSGAGRTDRLPLSVAADSHVIPADVVSGLGQGSTEAGARVLEASLATGPWGMHLPHEVRGHGPPRPPGVPSFLRPEAHGGQAHSTSILAASGEIVCPPRDVEALGRRMIAAGKAPKDASPMKVGHDELDRMIKRVRDFQIQWLKKAPPPKKSAGGMVGMAA